MGRGEYYKAKYGGGGRGRGRGRGRGDHGYTYPGEGQPPVDDQSVVLSDGEIQVSSLADPLQGMHELYFPLPFIHRQFQDREMSHVDAQFTSSPSISSNLMSSTVLSADIGSKAQNQALSPAAALHEEGYQTDTIICRSLYMLH